MDIVKRMKREPIVVDSYDKISDLWRKGTEVGKILRQVCPDITFKDYFLIKTIGNEFFVTVVGITVDGAKIVSIEQSVWDHAVKALRKTPLGGYDPKNPWIDEDDKYAGERGQNTYPHAGEESVYVHAEFYKKNA